MITFAEIQKANEGLASIDVKGKDYVLVAQRVKAFRMLFPEGFIKSDIISLENGVCVMQSRVGYYDNGAEIVLGTGTAYEKEENGFINKTSFIENTETSAVGRALGFLSLGIDGGGICSAEELANAIRNQKDNTVRVLPVKNDEQSKAETTVDLTEIRTKLDVTIKAVTKDMNRDEKIQFIRNVVMPALNGERNWRLCEDINLLMTLMKTIEAKAA